MTTPTPEEIQDKLDAALKSIERLETKNREILDENKRRKAEAEEARDAAETAAEEKARASKDVEALEKSITKKFEKQIADLTRTNETYAFELSTLKIDNAIQANLAKHNIDPVHHEILTDALKAKAKLDGTDAKIGDLSIEDHIASFAASDVGKRYIAAPANGGAGATGSKVTGGDAIPAEWNFTQYTKIKESNPEAANAYAKKHNQPFAQ